ncbi:hypoxanthine phosphoribosyltransferase [Natronoglycomyces albus]|uniref:Hypoxanthine phosphoribosyltransferase n=1 Tax=Natronoglycomyces albus TaxID=2811108 RepID=A0A895XV07_9ACTN|nr:hypoxanthine phosphoribosyltransferase [Natronoglycomyces albus]
MDANAWYADQIDRVIIDEAELAAKVKELAKEISADFADVDGVLLVGVFKGAVMFMADLARALTVPVEMEFMALSSYGNAATSSGTVRIMKDLDTDLKGKHVIVVEDIIDSGLTLSWLLKYLGSRSPESVSVVSMLRKPDAQKIDVPVRYLGFDIPNEFVVGYGLDFAERYRELPFIGVVKPEVYQK